MHHVSREPLHPLAGSAEYSEALLRRRCDAQDRVRRSMGRLRAVSDEAGMVHAAPVELCETCGFDRAVLSRIRGSEVVIESAYCINDSALAACVLEYGKTNRLHLDDLRIESEMVKRGGPVLVRDAGLERGSPAGFLPLLQMRAYVAAPIMPSGRAVGFLHADLSDSGRAPDLIDRDRLWAFAEGLRLAIERTVMHERLHTQARRIDSLLRSAELTLDALWDVEIELAGLASGPLEAAEGRPAPGSAMAEDEPDVPLSARERQVVELMARGATNEQIGDQLMITVSTVKSHVAHVLRKLQSSNRVEAVVRYLHRDPPDRRSG